MTRFRLILSSIALMLLAAACHPGVDDWDDDARGNFDAVWSIVDRHYCFFAEKDVDWDEVYARYSPRVSDKMTADELFTVCSEMLDELRDGHVNLSSPYATSYYRRWWSDYPENYNDRLIEQYYFNFNYSSIGPFTYGYLPENIAYMRISTFSSGIGDGNLDYILNYFSTATGLIIDVRSNGGGDLTRVEQLVARFTQERMLAGYISHKTGPAHEAFSEPCPFYYSPAGDGHVVWSKPVVILTNRGTFSAANNFVSIMRCLPSVTLIGATTGGGSGMPYSSEIPCGWGLRLSAVRITDPQGRNTETGCPPDIAVDLDPTAALQGHDTILDAAVNYLESQPQ